MRLKVKPLLRFRDGLWHCNVLHSHFSAAGAFALWRNSQPYWQNR